MVWHTTSETLVEVQSFDGCRIKGSVPVSQSFVYHNPAEAKKDNKCFDDKTTE
jgi:hypothetical protein